MFQALGEEVAKFQAAHPARPFWGLRVVWSAMRDQDARSIIEHTDDCIATKLAWPQLVAGYDLAGPGSLGRPLADLIPELFWFRKQCAVEGVQIPLFLRAGERPRDGHAADDNLFDALLLGARRIGNAMSLDRHPRLVGAVKDRRILVESCVTSTDALGLTGSIVQHPLPSLLAQGVPCALCHDIDIGVVGEDCSSRMTNEFWHVLHAWKSMDLASLGSLAENSVRWAAFEDQDAETW